MSGSQLNFSLNYNLMKTIIFLSGCLLFFNVGSQNNIIPNGNFENNKQTIDCSALAGCATNMNLFNNLIYNWEAAIHNNDASNKNDIGNIYYFDVSVGLCNNLIFSDNTFCSVLIPSPTIYPNDGYYSIIGTKFVRIRADIDKKNYKLKHAAIGVALENGQKFKKNQSYIIRYKIVPIRSRNCYDLDENPIIPSQFYTHIRFFLSELGPKHWDKSNSDKQEIISANYIKNTYYSKILSNGVYYVPCYFSQVERGFVPNQDNYTTLVIYVENGGVFIDDVEVFEQCASPYYIQNKLYSSPIHAPNAVEGHDMKEESGGKLIAGNNVTNEKNTGDVIIQYGAKVIFTAADEIELSNGFYVDQGAEFAAEISPCPNSFDFRISNNTVKEVDSLDVLMDDMLYTNNAPLQIIPNPAQNVFYIGLNEEDWYDLTKIELITPLGQVKELPKEMQQNISDMSNGIYFLKFYFSSGVIVVKPLMIQR